MVPPKPTSRRSRSQASPRRRRSRRRHPCSPPTAPPTSAAYPGSTAASPRALEHRPDGLAGSRQESPPRRPRPPRLAYPVRVPPLRTQPRGCWRRGEVEGERADTGPGSIDHVDIVVAGRRGRNGSCPSCVPTARRWCRSTPSSPAGSSFAERSAGCAPRWRRSEEVAAAVALREAGHPVQRRPAAACSWKASRPMRRPARARAAGRHRRGRRSPRAHAPAAPRSARPAEAGPDRRLDRAPSGTRRTSSARTVPDPADTPRRPLIGIRVGQDAEIELPIDVDIDLGDVGGPSAGLAFALDVLEELGHNVDRGHRVVATGEIELDGSVRPIGGVKQKTFGVREGERRTCSSSRLGITRRRRAGMRGRSV